MEQNEPTLVGQQRRCPRADLVIGKGYILHRQKQLRIAPVAQIGRIGYPDVKPVLPARIHRERPLKPHVPSAGLPGKKSQIPVVGSRNVQYLQLLLKRIRRKVPYPRDPAADAVPRVNRKAHVQLVLYNGEPRIIYPPDLGIVKVGRGQKRSVRHGKSDPVAAPGRSQVAARERALAVEFMVISENHYKLAPVKRDARIENAVSVIRHHFPAQDGRAAVDPFRNAELRNNRILSVCIMLHIPIRSSFIFCFYHNTEIDIPSKAYFLYVFEYNAVWITKLTARTASTYTGI